jgi:hypothetical protein
MTPHRDAVTLLLGDCVEQMAKMDESSIDAVVCDPPYGLEFMGKEWDSIGGGAKIRHGGGGSYGGTETGKRQQEWHQRWATEAYRVLKPGGHLLAFGGTRTYHRLVCAVEDAGFEIRDSIHWVYGSGFPKSKNVALAIDKGEGHPNRGRAIPTASTYQACDKEQENKLTGNPVDDYEAVTDEAKKWDGWGTAMKPSHEPLVVARKPLIGTVAANVLEHGTGALNIDACRVVTNGEKIQVPQSDPTKRAGVVGTDLGISGARIDDFQAAQAASVERTNTLGRWPPNLLLSHAEGCVQVGERVIKGQEGDESIPVYDCAPNCPVAEMDRQSGEHDTGGASRFFPVFKYQPKASKSERNEGLDVGLLCSRCAGSKSPPTTSTSALKVGSFMDDADRATSKGLSPTKVRGKCADCGREVMQQDESVRVMAGNSHP